MEMPALPRLQIDEHDQMLRVLSNVSSESEREEGRERRDQGMVPNSLKPSREQMRQQPIDTDEYFIAVRKSLRKRAGMNGGTMKLLMLYAVSVIPFPRSSPAKSERQSENRGAGHGGADTRVLRPPLQSIVPYVFRQGITSLTVGTAPYFDWNRRNSQRRVRAKCTANCGVIQAIGKTHVQFSGSHENRSVNRSVDVLDGIKSSRPTDLGTITRPHFPDFHFLVDY
jgi:hypothetical protein